MFFCRIGKAWFLRGKVLGKIIKKGEGELTGYEYLVFFPSEKKHSPGGGVILKNTCSVIE